MSFDAIVIDGAIVDGALVEVVITDHPDGHREVEVRVEDEQAPE